MINALSAGLAVGSAAHYVRRAIMAACCHAASSKGLHCCRTAARAGAAVSRRSKEEVT